MPGVILKATNEGRNCVSVWSGTPEAERVIQSKSPPKPRKKYVRPPPVPPDHYRTKHIRKRNDKAKPSRLTTKRRRISQRRYVITDKSHIQKLLQKCTPKS